MGDNPFKIGDPVVDLAQGRPMVVIDAPNETVAEWSDNNGYELQDNYANSKFDPLDDESVVECVYVSDVRSEPSKTYTFPTSRVALIDVHHADGGKRLYDRVAVEILADLFRAANDRDSRTNGDSERHNATLQAIIRGSDMIGQELAREANELAQVDHLTATESGESDE